MKESGWRRGARAGKTQGLGSVTAGPGCCRAGGPGGRTGNSGGGIGELEGATGSSLLVTLLVPLVAAGGAVVSQDCA